MRAVVVALVVLAVASAGCLSGDGGPEGGPANASGDDVERTGPVPEPPSGSDPTLAEPPGWEPGTWWRYRVTERFAGSTYTTTRVVARDEPGTDSHLVGMPNGSWSDKALVLHVPGFGRVDRTNLSFDIHDCPFTPVRFPLEEGREWTTKFECRQVNATVDSVDGSKATIRMIGNDDDLTLTYDADRGVVTKLDIDDYGLIEVVDAGTDFEGQVIVPHNHDLVFQHGRIAGVLGARDLVGPPVETVDVDDTYHRVSFVLGLGTLLPDDQSPQGVYREEAVAPDGTNYSAVVTPADDAGLHFSFFQHDDPGGTWQLRHLAGGPGIAFVEGIGYHVFEETVPPS